MENEAIFKFSIIRFPFSVIFTLRNGGRALPFTSAVSTWSQLAFAGATKPFKTFFQ